MSSNPFVNKRFLDVAMNTYINQICDINTTINGNIINKTITVYDAIKDFLNNQTNVSDTYYYDTLIGALNYAQDKIIETDPIILGGSTRTKFNFRYLVTSDDGTVIADSSKTNNIFGMSAKPITTNSSDPLNNLYISSIISSNGSGFLGKAINENHHSRPELLYSLINNSGIGYCRRYSSSIKAKLYYICKRIGGTSEENLGSLRLSIQVSN